MTNTTHRPLWLIGMDIREAALAYKREKGKAPSWLYYSEDYLNALLTLNTIDEMYYADTAESVVRYLLSNLNTWRGEQARKIKEELKSMLTY